ncbi:MAG: 16S rRNA (cytosine(967)-C(5))-methyltransferase RsmB [Myxococcota bacterium]|nr:16S rRNA (cytosine(967)-C(5))-methyltransferase RsmB [Myxococcota bacterium]
MSAESGRGARPGRGRPSAPGRGDRRRSPAPTHTRLLALRVLERVQRAGAYADLSLHFALSHSSLNAPDRAFATDLVYGTLRWRGQIDFYLRHFVDQDLEKLEPLVATALRLGAYQLLFGQRIPASAAVDQSVRCIRAAGVDRASGLVNAVLRRLDVERESVKLPTVDSNPHAHLTHVLSVPSWLSHRWIDQFGVGDAVAMAEASNRIPPLTIRANRQLVDRDELLDRMRENFPDAMACRFARDGIVLGRAGNPTRDSGFLAGHFTVQDEASQLVVGLLDPQAGERILDVCAAPGGKTTAIAERIGPEGMTLGIDRHPRRLALVRRAARRLQLRQIHCTPRDVSRPIRDLTVDGGFDRVLVDAPCSGLGTLRRNPDARWRVRAGDPGRLAEVQLSIMSNAAAVLRPGGILVYSTCTLMPEENEEIADTFLKNFPDFALTPADAVTTEVRALIASDGFLRCFPHIHDTDGFFAARFERRK